MPVWFDEPGTTMWGQLALVPGPMSLTDDEARVTPEGILKTNEQAAATCLCVACASKCREMRGLMSGRFSSCNNFDAPHDGRYIFHKLFPGKDHSLNPVRIRCAKSKRAELEQWFQECKH